MTGRVSGNATRHSSGRRRRHVLGRLGIRRRMWRDAAHLIRCGPPMKIRHWLAFPLLALSANCSAPDDSAHPREIGQLGQALFAAAHEADVAEPLLYAITSIEDGFDEPLHRSPDPNAEAPQAGPFHLRHGKLDSLEAAARIAGVSELALREDTALAARAGAKLLAEVLARHGASVPVAAVAAPDRVEWASVKAALAEWSGYSDSWHQSDYATRVLGVLARGGEYRNGEGELFNFDAMPVPPALLVGEPKPVELLALVAELEGAELFPMNPNVTGKFLAGRDGYSVDTLIVHDTEGGWEGAVSTFQNQGSTSVHYLIGKDGRLAQFMPEADTGYHCGNRIYNRRSIGVEHVGFTLLGTWSWPMMWLRSVGMPYFAASLANTIALFAYCASGKGRCAKPTCSTPIERRL
ncbi:MAG: N-acetylmuramoyl-L-alanine amidase [Proteobacteria bacterium]|nr:MAG: N-acetylmuramoyl-L-alanine amidase [Pseudomonadota bacterium]